MRAFRWSMILGAAALAGSLWAAEPPTPSADELYKAFMEARSVQYEWQRMPGDTDEQKTARDTARRTSGEALVQTAGEFLAAFPEDTRKWEVLSAMIGAEHNFTGPTARADELAWKSYQNQSRELILNSAGVPDEVWERMMTGEIMLNRRAMEAEQKRTGKADSSAWRAALDRLAARVPMTKMLGPFEGHYAEFLLKENPAAGEKFLQQRTTSANPQVAAMARGKLNILALEKAPVDLKFTAADGSAVDLASLRGKVVIIDFWATWCVPCLKEFPNTKAAYDAYKDHGVQMIGISFDHEPKDAAKPTKSDRTKDQFIADAAKLGMSWPQYYDGKGWDCDLGRRFDITSIPRVWVLDKNGMLKTQHARGRKIWDLLAENTGYTAPIPEQFAKEEKD